MTAIAAADDFLDIWSPPPGTPAPSPDDTDRFAVWLMRSLGDPEWNPDRTDRSMQDWQEEMVRLISVYRASRMMDDARRAGIHHAKLMHRHLLDLGYPASAELDIQTFVWWMKHRKEAIG